MNKRKFDRKVDIEDPELKFNLEYLLNKVCEISNIAISQIRGDIHKREITDVRHAFAYMAKCTYPKLKSRELGSLLNVDRTTISYYLKEINLVKEKKNVYLTLREEIINAEN